MALALKFKTLTLVIITLLSLLKFKNCNFINYLREHHDGQVLKTFRNLISNTKKLEKANLDLEFLVKCKTYDVTPKFLRFKLYKKCLQSLQFYKSWQVKLLTHEISSKKKLISELEKRVKDGNNTLGGRISSLEHLVAANRLKKIVQPYILKNRHNHNKKLDDLGVSNQLVPVDPSRVVHNFSSVKLPEKIKFLLAFGLQFNLPVFNIDFYKFFHPLEKIAYYLKGETCHGNSRDFFEKLKNVVNKYYYSFKSSKVFSPIFNIPDVQLLKSFSKDHRDKIVVPKPDNNNNNNNKIFI